MAESDKTTNAASGGEELTLAEKRKRFEARKAELFASSKSSKVPTIAVAVDAQTAENAKARPESIRIGTRDESGRHRVVGPQRYALDTASSAVGWMSWGRPGTLSSPGLWFSPDGGADQVRHTYNPIDALKREDD